MSDCHACNTKPCCCAGANGLRQPYEDDCEHDYDEDEDTCEYVCIVCGDRQPVPLDKLIHD